MDMTKINSDLAALRGWTPEFTNAAPKVMS
jgi:hypothetical protein